MGTRRFTASLAMAAAGALVVAGCGGSSSDSEADGASVAPDEIITDIGVTAEACPEAVNPDNGCIYLGILSDLTEGPFAPLATEVVTGQEAFWASVNAEGGVGGYDVNVSEYTRDNKYDPAVHSQEYRSIEPNVLALAQSLGTAQTQAILSDMDADDVVAAPASWWSGWQFPEDDNGLVLESGSSYCIMAMSGLDWYSENKNEITKVVAVGPPGDFGGDYAAGVQAWAEANDVEFGGFIEALPNSLAGNQDATVQQILDSGADVVALAHRTGGDRRDRRQGGGAGLRRPIPRCRPDLEPAAAEPARGRCAQGPVHERRHHRVLRLGHGGARGDAGGPRRR